MIKLLFLLLFSNNVWTNDSLPYRKITYRVQVKTTADSLLSGYLHLIKDSSIVFSFQPAAYGHLILADSREIPCQWVPLSGAPPNTHSTLPEVRSDLRK
jgi:hypothetical protein